MKKASRRFLVMIVLCLLAIGHRQLDSFSQSVVKTEGAPPKNLTLKMVVDQILIKDETLQNTLDKLTSKRLETDQIKRQIIKQMTSGEGVSFETLQKADLEKEKGLHDLVESFAVVQNLDNEIVSLEMDVQKRSMTLRTEAKQTYLDICIQEKADAFYTERIGQLEPKIAQLSESYLLGKVKKEALNSEKEALQEAKEAQLKAQTLATLKRETLAKAMGEENLDVFLLTYEPKPVVYEAKSLEKIKLIAYANNVDLKKANLEAAQASRDLADLFEMAKLQYGDLVLPLIDQANKKPVDYQSYFSNYATLLEAPKRQEVDQYPLRLGFYRLDVKTNLIKTAIKALEYTQKERYPIQYALNARDLRQTNVSEVKKQIEVNFGSIQAQLVTMNDEQMTKQEQLKLAMLTAQNLEKQNLVGKINYQEVVQNQLKIQQLTYDLSQLALAIEKQWIDLDQLTSGVLTGSFVKESQPLEVTKPSWWIGPAQDRFGVTFTLKLPKGVQADTFICTDASGKPLTAKTSIGKTVTIRPFVEGKDTTCTIEIYAKDKRVKQVKINGSLPMGNFDW